MSKKEFIEKLERGLKGLPEADICEHVSFYTEMIDDRIEEGLSEEDAVSQIGSVNDVISQILSETPITKLIKEKVKPKRALKAWEIVLIALGSPIWFSLLIAALSVLFASYVTVWALLVSFFAVEVSLGIGSICGVLALFLYGFSGSWPTGFAFFGVGICLAGLTILLSLITTKIVKGIFILTKKMTVGIKSMFIGGSK